MRWFKKDKVPVLLPKEGYSLWANSYATERNPIKDFSNARVEQLLPDLNGKTVLDAGCGTGYFCSLAKSKGAKHIVGVDFSEAMIKQAAQYCPSAELHCRDISTFSSTPHLYDVIICALVLAHIEDFAAVLSNFAEFLKKDGLLVLSDFHPYLTTNNSRRTFKDSITRETKEIQHFLHPLEKIIDHLKKEGFSIERLEEPQWNNTPVIYALSAKKE